MRAFNYQNTLSNGYGLIIQNTTNLHNNDPQMNAAEQAQTEEKRSLTALNYFISKQKYYNYKELAFYIFLLKHRTYL